jgi:hypothetical protein
MAFGFVLFVVVMGGISGASFARFVQVLGKVSGHD